MTNESKLREALQKIADWQLPATGKFWDDDEKTRPISYEAAYGSHGSQEYMRRLAVEALALPITAPGAEVVSNAVLAKVCDLLRIGALARSESTILTNVRNAVHFSALLHAVENDLFPKPDLPDDDDPYAEVAEDLPAPNSWAAKDPADYVAQFRAALLARFGAQPAAATHQQGLQVAEGVAAGFPARIMTLLAEVADRKGSATSGPWEDGDGEPLQDDADIALAWIARAAVAASPSQSPAPLPEAQPVSDNGAAPSKLEIMAMLPDTRAMQVVRSCLNHAADFGMTAADLLEAMRIVAPAQAHGKSGAVAMPAYGEIPWGDLKAAVSEATGGTGENFEWAKQPDTFIGHCMAPVNMNSLNRIVSLFVRRALAAAAPASVPGAPVAGEGWKLVPVKPTQEMIDAGDKWAGVKDCYLAMLAAAPVPKAPDAEKDAARYRWLRDCPDVPWHVFLPDYGRIGVNASVDESVDAALQAEAQKTGGAA